ncbi:peptidylprolyl isomerase [Kiloniella sp. b19]|uniref:peptidylprolyl isomerase n=1 Tax=Kiloniella sp. GXU_MW_B19 TaxID=3141326 RepID=UPI0031D1DAA8
MAKRKLSPLVSGFAIAAMTLVAAPLEQTIGQAHEQQAQILRSDVFSLFSSKAHAQSTLRPVAIVNDDIISLIDVIQRSRLAMIGNNKKLNQKQQQQLLNRTLRTMIDDRIKLQEAERLNISISQGELNAALQGIASQNNQTPEQVLSTLRTAGIHQETLFDQFRAELAWRQVVRRSLNSDVVVSEAEIDSVVDRIQQLGTDTEKRIFEIFLPSERDTTESELKDQATSILQELKNGANFGAVARVASRSSSASFGGDLGWVQAGQLPRELQQIAAQATPGNLIGPIQTRTGFYILMIQDERKVSSDAKLDLALMRIALAQNADFDAQQAARSRIADIERNVQTCANVRDRATELGDEGSGELGVKDIKELDSAVQQAVQGLQRDQKSAIIRKTDGFEIYYICGRQESGSGVNRLEIEQKLRDDRINILAEKHLQDLRRSANIDIRL